MAPRLKVFTWSDGFHAFSVATTSRPKALEAWGMEGDIFKTGLASQIEQGPDHAAALERPGDVIRRGLAVDNGSLSRSPPARSESAGRKRAKAKAQVLEDELTSMDERHADERRAVEARLAAIETERADLDQLQAKERGRLKAARAKL